VTNEIDHKASRQRLVISGNVEAPLFIPWIERHGSKLGLTHIVCRQGLGCIEMEAEGIEEMLDAMEVGCLLGPAEVWVESINRTRLTN
jgi:acylphosphatase